MNLRWMAIIATVMLSGLLGVLGCSQGLVGEHANNIAEGGAIERTYCTDGDATQHFFGNTLGLAIQ